ncbi:hypothetical protein PFLUV_G00229640 [Scomber scombrus]|uniref:Immunoglobulin V-set domain-containing protein n=1 Tax=Scomber scombrus TaxID=13677 RepID=A0AAV1QHX0_SCOSC
MMPHLITYIVAVFWIKGVYLNKENQVSQEPRNLLWKLNDGVKLSFTHNIPNYDTILWYQRSAGDTALKLIAYMYYKNINIESPFQSRFNVSGDGVTAAYLHILNLTHSADSGEYFGAASMHSDKDSDSLIQKPL